MTPMHYRPVAVLFVTVCSVFACDWPHTIHAAEPWIDTCQVGPFICHSTFQLDEYKVLFAELPELQRELSRTLGLRPAQAPMSVFLFTDESEHRKFLTEHYGHVPYRRALFVKEGGRAGVYAYRHAELDVDLRHECTHALLHSVLPAVPLWLDEGLAEYFEVPAAQRAFDHPHFDTLRWNMRLGMVQTIETLERRENLADMNGYDYRYSWAWVHFMLHGPEPAHRTLVNYIASLQRGGLPAAPGQNQPVRLATYAERADTASLTDSLGKTLAENVPSPTERMVHHFKHWHQ